jgi:Kef-type K+ transport system membrane component KefB
MLRSIAPNRATALIALAAGVAMSLAAPLTALAAEGEGGEGERHWGLVFLMFAIVLLAGKMGDIVEKFDQPAVIGELLAGIILAVFGYLGWGLMDDITANETIGFLASLGALLLLFSIGLESNLTEMRQVGLNAFLVAVIGVAVPFALGTLVLGPIFFGSESTESLLFLGAALVATSVGITASVFRSMGITRTRAAQTVLGAAVIDDVLGLIVLAVVSALASGGEVGLGMIVELLVKSFGFLAGAIVIGAFAAKQLSRLFATFSTGVGMKLAVALGMALGLGYLAEVFGLEPIIGAFAAGLILDAVYFDRYADAEFVENLRAIPFHDHTDEAAVNRLIARHRHTHVEDLIGTLNMVFVPIFFVHTGMQIDIASLLRPELYVAGIVISLAAILGKIVAGIAAKGDFHEKLLVGISMVPRGEVGLIFAATGQALGVLNEEEFSVIILVVIITTFIAPPFISRMSGRERQELKRQAMERQAAAGG